MMHQKISLCEYAERSSYQAVELPCDGYDLSMDIIMPKAGQYGSFEQSLSGDVLDNILKAMDTSNVTLTMPKFSFETTRISLATALTQLGMGTAFSGNADFSGMDGQRDLYIGDVVHKAYISVDENGTEAAAATAVFVVGMGPPGSIPEVTLTLDHPFIFVIRDNKTGTILFIGRVLNPAS